MPDAIKTAPDSVAVSPSVPIGAARVLALGYGFFTLAAGARSGVQLATQYSRAPLAYLLSAGAAAIYLCGVVAMLAAERRPSRRGWARRVSLVELGGVALVGTASLVVPSAFPDATVWSNFGSGYAFVPIALPVLALLWTRRPVAALG